MKCFLFFAAGLLCFITSYAQPAEIKYSRKTVEDDLAWLYTSLQNTHYNLYAFQNKAAYNAQVEKVKKMIDKDSLTYLETVSLYQQVVSFANTGHCEIDYPVQAYIAYAYAGGTVFPMELTLEEGKVFIRNNYTGLSQIAIGSELLSIDDQPIQEIMESLYPYVSAERAYFKKSKIEFWTFPRLLYQAKGKKDEWKIKYKNASAQTLETTIKAIPVMDYEQNRPGEIVNPQQQLKFYGNTAYLNPGPFGSAAENGEQVFRRYVDSCFSLIRSGKSRNLVIDLRNNPGGDNAYSDYLVSYFAAKPFRWFKKFSLRTSAILKEKTRELDTTDAYAKAILNHRDGEIFNYDFAPQMPVEKSRRWKGKVYVLVNRQTYSMAAVCAAFIQDYRFGTIVGEETGDVPSLYASQFSYTLPLTGIVVKVPKGYIVRPNGNEKLEGVQPNILVRDHLLDEQDEVLETLLKRIR